MTRNIAISLFAIFFVFNRGYSQDSIPKIIALQELFDRADNNSKAIQLASSGIEEAREGVEMAKNAQFPDIQISASAAYMSDAYIVGLGHMSSGVYESPNFYNSYTLEAAYVVYAGGNIKRAVDISELQGQIASLGYQNTRMDIRLVLAGFYLDLYVVQNQIEVLKKNIGQTKLLLENMQTRLNAGTLVKSDLIRYELQLSNLEFALSKAENRRDKLNHNLVETLGFQENTQLVASAPVRTLDDLPDTLGHDAIEGNIDVQVAEIQNKIAEKNADINRNNIMPNVALFATNDCSRPYIYDLPPVDIYTNVWLVGVSVSFDIGKLYKNPSNVSHAKVQMQESIINQALVVEKTKIALHDAFVDYHEAVEQLTVSQKELDLAVENYEMVISQYNNQLALITDVMDASNSKLNAELQLENSKMAILFAYYKIKRITGTL